MTIYRIESSTERRLLEEPESGMGFQVVRYRNSPLVIFNVTTAIELEVLRASRLSEDDLLFLSGGAEMDTTLEPLSLEDQRISLFSTFDAEVRDDDFGLSFSETAAEPSERLIPKNRPHGYYRYSAFYRDKRVRPNGDFIPGTYATTYADMHFVPSGYAAVGRYALPNPASACYLFQIVTYDRPTLMGTATPNFGQAGGGVEVLFGNGASNSVGNSFRIAVG